MFHRSPFHSTAHELVGAASRSQAIIEFGLDGSILHANENYLRMMGYRIEEIVGRHHGIFVDAEEGRGQDYRDFWKDLRSGEYKAAEFRRLAKGGRDVWIQATYNPVIGRGGKPVRIVKFATDITDQKRRTLAEGAQVDSVRRSQAVIRFDLDGTITDANELFLTMMGYELKEIIGKNHRMCVAPDYAASREYAEFWEGLRRGEFRAAEYCRLGKHDRKVWIMANYTPVLGLDGKPTAIVKFAVDVTDTKLRNADFEGQIDAINRSQAVIHFSMDGTVLDANRNFLDALGYELDEVKGQKHSLFVDPGYAATQEYRAFWEKLGRGEFHSAVYRRVGKNGRAVWINATYNPVFDLNGKPWKVVKYASDITAQMESRNRAVSFADHTLSNVQSVAAAVEQMTASANEIAGTMRQSREIVETISRQASDADIATQRLQDTASAMDQVVQLIRTIASQINLLSLNATIESARAGEEGKGFAVVANEVKQLANQTTAATQKVAEEIKSVQTVSSEVAGSLGLIGNSVASLLQFVNAAAGAVDEQNSATREISSNMQEAARDVAGINASLAEGRELAA